MKRKPQPNRNRPATNLALRLVASGLTISEAARRIGSYPQTVRRALRRAGEPPREPGYYPDARRREARRQRDAKRSRAKARKGAA